MTDREAIRRLAGIVKAHAEATRAWEIKAAVDWLLNDLAEPAAPTDDALAHTHLRCSRCGGYYRPGTAHDCSPTVTRCEDDHLPAGTICPKCGGRRLPSGAGGGSWVHAPEPTVTREQAERVIRILERMPPDQRMAMPKDWPAFFRAVADALEGE